MIGDTCYANVYQSDACYSYNKIKIGKKIVNIGTIFTILSFYLIFLFAGESEYDKNRILCTSYILQNIYLRNRLKNTGVLKVFTIQCEGKQETLEDILTEKRNKFKTLKKSSKEYEKWFLKYVPKGNSKNDKVLTKSKSKKSKTGGNSSKKSNKKYNNNKTFYYVYMQGCPYCIEFDNTGIFETLKDEFDDMKFVKIDGPKNKDFCQKYNIQSFPKLMLIESDKHKIFPSDDRNLTDLRKFLM